MQVGKITIKCGKIELSKPFLQGILNIIIPLYSYWFAYINALESQLRLQNAGVWDYKMQVTSSLCTSKSEMHFQLVIELLHNIFNQNRINYWNFRLDLVIELDSKMFVIARVSLEGKSGEIHNCNLEKYQFSLLRPPLPHFLIVFSMATIIIEQTVHSYESLLRNCTCQTKCVLLSCEYAVFYIEIVVNGSKDR